MEQEASYPVRFSVEYPERDLNRLTTFFRLFIAIPILIVLGSVSGETWQSTSDQGTAVVASAGGLLFFAPLLLILFRQKYPRWWLTGIVS
jgi:O-antigen/teichoic acid export membrane protein